jgi:hypothetical protein
VRAWTGFWQVAISCMVFPEAKIRQSDFLHF